MHSTSGPVNGDCVSNISKGMVMTYASTAYMSPKDWTIVTTTMSSASSVGAIAVVGFNVARDISTTASSSSETPTSGQTGPVTPGSAPSTSTPSPSILSQSSSSDTPSSSTAANPSTDEGMSVGMKAGIGLGVGLGILGIIALIFAIILLVRRRSKGKPQGTDSTAPVPAPYDDKNAHGLGGYQGPAVYYGHNHPPGMQGVPQEVHAYPPTYELPSEQIHSPVEMGHGRGI
jgi:hypothetical protein